MSLSHFVRQHRELLADEWERYASTQLPAAEGLTNDELRDSAGELLEAIADDMDSTQSMSERQHKALGLRPGHAPDISKYGHRHADTRLAQGFTLDQVVSEYRAMRACVLREWVAEERSAVDDVNEVIRFGESIDQCLSETIFWYGGHIARARELFLGVLSHDLRTPLGAIRMSADLLLKDESLSPVATRIAVRVATSANRMTQMIDDLLDFTQTRLGTRLPLHVTRLSLAPLLKESVEELRASHPDADLDYLGTGELDGEWDGGRIAQLLGNLVSNAIQHGEPGRPVTVRAEGKPLEVVVSIHNEGPPITPTLRNKIFDPLLRGVVQAAEDRSHRGSLGLGLYIAREIARAHGGEISVFSSAEAGTTFMVHLPKKTAATRTGTPKH